MSDEKNSAVSEVGAGVSAIGEVLRIAGDDPRAKEAARNLGQAAVTVTKALNVVLLPLAAVNFAYDKARQYFQDGRFAQDLESKSASIPPEDVIEPKASIAGPAIQGLAFSHEEDELKELYLNLLKSAMDRRVANSAHPAFVEVIKQMTATEAELLRSVLTIEVLPIADLRWKRQDQPGYTVIYSHLVNYKKDGGAQEVAGLPTMIDNWIRLGLIDVDMMSHLTREDSYDWVNGRPELVKLKLVYERMGGNVEVGKGIMRATSFGRQFASSVGMLNISGVVSDTFN